MFRLGKFYKVDYFRDQGHQALKCLETMFATYATRDLKLKGRMIMRPSTVFSCINFAREHGLTSILPFAFARLHRTSAKRLLGGITRPDGTLAKLSSSDQRIALTGLATFRAAEAKEMFGTLLSSENTCRRGPCLQARLERATTFWNTAVTIEEKFKSTPLTNWQPEWELGLCNTCRLNAQTEYEAGRNRVWKKLPSFFELPPWEEISNTQVSPHSFVVETLHFLLCTWYVKLNHAQ